MAPATDRALDHAGDLAQRLASGEESDVTALLVVAHPDDEALGAGGLLPRFGDAHVLHLTDGAPPDPDAPDLADPRRLAYAERRREELDCALTLAGVPPARRYAASAVDQHALEVLPHLIGAIRSLIARWRPEVVLTHPYEGGHPDHDAAAFAVAAALALQPGPLLLELAFYHGEGGAFVPQRFLGDDPGLPVAFDAAAKARLLACHASQRDALAPFSAATERLRVAPTYAFDRPPHDGPLWYERQGWSSGVVFRARVHAALRDLGLEPWWA